MVARENQIEGERRKANAAAKGVSGWAIAPPARSDPGASFSSTSVAQSESQVEKNERLNADRQLAAAYLFLCLRMTAER